MLKRATIRILSVVYIFLIIIFLGFENNSIAADRSAVEDFVSRFYRLCLVRSPDPAGLNGWVEPLLDGTNAGADVGYGFIFSEEGKRELTTDEKYITVLYEAFFDRRPDPIGLQGWLDALSGGTSRVEVLDGFIYSTEFNNLCNKFGIQPYIPLRAFITRFYRLCLKREPDPAGLEGWIQSLRNQSNTGADVAKGFVYSTEFVNLGTKDEEYLTILYKAFFNRKPDEVGWNGWMSELDKGKDRREVLEGFILAQEFVDLCTKFRIIPYPGKKLDLVAISGTITPPIGVPADSFEVICLGEKYPVNDSGRFSADIYEDGVAIVAAMQGGKEFGLMNVAVSNTNSEVIELNYFTTAISMLFVTPYFFTSDPKRASDLLSIVKNDKEVVNLAAVIDKVFNEADPLENEELKIAFEKAIFSVLETIETQNKNEQTKNVTIPPKNYVLSLTKTQESVANALKTNEVNIDLQWLKLDVSSRSNSYLLNIEVAPILVNPISIAVDWLAEVAELEENQFESIDDLIDRSSNNLNVYNRKSDIGLDTAKAGGIRKLDVISEVINEVFDTIGNIVAPEGVKVPSNKDAVYIVRSFSGGLADLYEIDLINSGRLPNGIKRGQQALFVNLVAVALDALSVVYKIDLDQEKVYNLGCLVDVAVKLGDSLSHELSSYDSDDDIIKIYLSIFSELFEEYISCKGEDYIKSKVAEWIKKITVKSIEATYLKLKAGLTAGTIVERVLDLTFNASPVESIFIVVGNPFQPSVPQDLTATALGPHSIELAWSAATDNVGIAGYRVYKIPFGELLIDIKGVETKFVVDELRPNTEYCYRVAAYDLAGNNSAESETACATTDLYSNPLDGVPTFTPHPSNPLIDDCRIYGITEVKKYGQNEYRGFAVKRNTACDYPADFNVDLLTSNDGIFWTETKSGILNQNITGKTFNYRIAELKDNGVYKAWHVATNDWCISLDNMYYSESYDGLNYTMQSIAFGRTEPFETRSISKHSVLNANGEYFIYYDPYIGGTCSGYSRTGVAVATSDNGKTNWTKHGNVLDTDYQLPKFVYDSSQFEAFTTKDIPGERVPVYLVSDNGIDWIEVGVIDSLPSNINISGVVKEGNQYSIWYYNPDDLTFNLATGKK